MPACSSENMTKIYPSSPPTSRSNSASPPLPSSPLSSSPPQVCPLTNFESSNSEFPKNSAKHSTNWSQLSSSTTPMKVLPQRRQKYQYHQTSQQFQNEIIHHHHHHHKLHRSHQSTGEIIPTRVENKLRFYSPTRIISWYFNLVFGIIWKFIDTMIFIIRAPAVWASAWICILLVVLQLPLTFLKWFIALLHTPTSEFTRNKRCVLISGGSTVQAVHLARNFYQAGARVIVCEVEGLFGLARFSTACSKFYTIPRPSPGNAAEYVKALKTIIEKEKAVYYIPVSSTNAAYYDALAKPHLELIGCECFVPGASEVTALDDPLELLRRCRLLGLETPTHFVLQSADDVTNIYENGTLRSGRHVMLAAGPAGMRDRVKIQLPPSVREFQNLRQEISEKRPWVVIRDPGGAHFITCTTVKESRIVANVTCRVDESRGLIPETNNDISQWLERFFARSFGSNKINGHLSFRLVQKNNDEYVTIGCRVGVGLPYVCLTSIHPRLVWRPCRHFSRQNSGPLIVGEHFRPNDAFPSAIKQATCHMSSALGSVIDKREALFVYWDPLPYCAYYHLQLPFNRFAGAIRVQPNQHTPPLGVVQ